MFKEHGNIVEVILVKDKRFGHQEGFCFVKYAMVEEADRAIRALHNQYTFPGEVDSIEVRHAVGRRERLGAPGEQIQVDKLYVGSLYRQATEKDIEKIFSPYGVVEDIFIVRDELKQSRGCGFVQFSNKDMAVAAMSALNGTYTMRGSDQPLIVRFAVPKKPRNGEPRGNFGYNGVKQISPSSLPEPNVMRQQSRQSSQEAISEMHTSSVAVVPSAKLASPVVSSVSREKPVLECDWSEHTCPDGFLYYYNCVTCESRWEKPREYSLFEQELRKQLQDPSGQHLQSISCQQELRQVHVRSGASTVSH